MHEFRSDERGHQRRRALIIIVATAAVVLTSGCNVGRAGARCRSGWARDATHVLACRRGRLVPVMTIADYLRLIAPHAAAPTSTGPPPSPPSPPSPPAAPAVPVVTTPPTTAPVAPHGPVVTSFSLGRATGTAPLTTTVGWHAANADGRAQRCQLDLDGDGIYELTVDPCPGNDERAVTFTRVGATTVSLRVDDGTSPAVVATTTATVTVPSRDTFGFQFRFDPSVTATQRTALTTAANRWQRVVRTGQPDAVGGVPADLNGCGNSSFGGTVDDLLVDVTVEPIDGPHGILGGAVVCGVRKSNHLPVFATMVLDVADLDLLSDTQLTSLVTHELGHALGIGDWPSVPESSVGAGSSDPRFVGPVAVAAWHGLGGTGGVPLENTGGTGTQDAHWRESVFDNELMTGWIDDSTLPLSTVTAGALADLGYGVDLAGADRFVLPGAGARANAVALPGLAAPRPASGGPAAAL